MEGTETVDMGRYRELLLRLKKNKENVPGMILLTRYRKPYDALRNEIAGMTCQILKGVALHGLRVRREGADAMYAVLNQAVAASGIQQEAGHAAYQEQDADKVLECAMRLRELLRQKVKEEDEDNDSARDADQGGAV